MPLTRGKRSSFPSEEPEEDSKPILQPKSRKKRRSDTPPKEVSSPRRATRSRPEAFELPAAKRHKASASPAPPVVQFVEEESEENEEIIEESVEQIEEQLIEQIQEHEDEQIGEEVVTEAIPAEQLVSAPVLEDAQILEEGVAVGAVVESVEDQYDRPPLLEREEVQEEEELMMMTEMAEDHQSLIHRPSQRLIMQHTIQPVMMQGSIDTDDGVIVADASQFDDETGMLMPDLRTVEFNFLDNKNICCGLCGEIVPYEGLMNDHLPNQHPEVLGDGDMTMEEIPYEEWLREKLRAEKRAIESGFKLSTYEAPARVHRSANRVQRRVSQIRVNPTEMSLVQLDAALKKKMVEKMGRKVPVTLVDKQHARCGLCNAVVSLNKKFEVVHLVRHFNAWHPSAHRCSGSWFGRAPTREDAKPLSQHDFAVIDSNNTTPDNLQCIWCGMFMDADSLAMHFDEVHPDDIEVPKCNLCLQELVINARMQEKYGEDYEISLPDEHHIRCGRYNATIGSEGALEKLIEKKLARRQERVAMGMPEDEDELDENTEDDDEDVGPEAFLNSRMSLGKRKKPKRQFIMPALRQAAPIDSEYVEPVTECHWKCKLCNGDILAAVISAGAIKHYRSVHPDHLDSMQYELCKARLERVSDGCMEFVHPQLIECLICNMTYNLHKPFNMCRAVRHLKSKHPNLMPEYAGVGTARIPVPEGAQIPMATRQDDSGVELRTVDSLDQLKEMYGIDISKMQQMTGADGEQVYVLMPEGTDIDAQTAEQLAAVLGSAQTQTTTEGATDASESSTRVLTLQVDKEGAIQADESRQTQQTQPEQESKTITTSEEPMPEPLTTE